MSAICSDCGGDTTPCTGKRGCRHAGRWEYYMVHNEVWARAGMPLIDRDICALDVSKCASVGSCTSPILPTLQSMTRIIPGIRAGFDRGSFAASHCFSVVRKKSDVERNQRPIGVQGVRKGKKPAACRIARAARAVRESEDAARLHACGASAIAVGLAHARRHRAHERGMLYFDSRRECSDYHRPGRVQRWVQEWGGMFEEIGRPPTACTERIAKYYFSPT
jgi:hypothetical protein